MRATRQLAGFQRGGWNPGSRHQKHQMLNPTLFLYRFPGPRGPGPFTMKYWWTLGCFPSGREVPFRLQEFLDAYQKTHVPVEVEEWLDCFVKHPAEQLVPTLEALLQGLESVDHMEEAEGYLVHEPSVAPLLAPLRQLESIVSVTIPPIAVRAVLADRALRDRVSDETYAYLDAVRTGGSTLHRRAGYVHLALSDGTPVDEEDVAKQGISRLEALSGKKSLKTGAFLPSAAPLPTDAVGTFVGRTLSSIPDETAHDERCLITMLTTFAEGAVKKKRFGDAANMLSSMLLFSHDDDTRAAVHANVATAHNLNGSHKEAEFHGREAALLRASPRGFINWATAVAYQDDWERASAILEDALVECPGDSMILHAQAQVAALRASLPSKDGTVPLELRGRRAHVPALQQKGLEEGEGRSFQNAFDIAVFKHQQITSKLDPTNFELGSVFRRVGDLGGAISSTKSMERI
jgi:hypothetical protein